MLLSHTFAKQTFSSNNLQSDKSPYLYIKVMYVKM